jgi:hypothetical protein
MVIKLPYDFCKKTDCDFCDRLNNCEVWKKTNLNIEYLQILETAKMYDTNIMKYRFFIMWYFWTKEFKK